MTETRQWEYYVETVGSAFKGIGDEDLAALLNELGQEGWEVFSVAQLESSVKSRIVAKRPIGHAATKHKHTWP